VRLLCSALALTAILGAGCAETSVPGESPITNDGTASNESTATVDPTGNPVPPTDQPVPPKPPPRNSPGRPKPDTDPPGALGSPIDYDSTQVGAGDRAPRDVKASVEGQLDEKTTHCAQKRCGITVVISGKGACAVSLSPPLSVKPRGVITVGTGPCPKPPDEEEATPSTGN
jgi:hypothetical protein